MNFGKCKWQKSLDDLDVHDDDDVRTVATGVKLPGMKGLFMKSFGTFVQNINSMINNTNMIMF